MITPTDVAIMQHLVEYTMQSYYTYRVGAFIVKPDTLELLGAAQRSFRVYETYADIRHAEITAILTTGNRCAGSTLFTTLEPCNHRRTKKRDTGIPLVPYQSCTDAIIASGIRRVVVGMIDPNPAIQGRSIEHLIQHGIAVEVIGTNCPELDEGIIAFSEKT